MMLGFLGWSKSRWYSHLENISYLSLNKLNEFLIATNIRTDGCTGCVEVTDSWRTHLVLNLNNQKPFISNLYDLKINHVHVAKCLASFSSLLKISWQTFTVASELMAKTDKDKFLKSWWELKRAKRWEWIFFRWTETELQMNAEYFFYLCLLDVYVGNCLITY